MISNLYLEYTMVVNVAIHIHPLDKVHHGGQGVPREVGRHPYYSNIRVSVPQDTPVFSGVIHAGLSIVSVHPDRWTALVSFAVHIHPSSGR